MWFQRRRILKHFFECPQCKKPPPLRQCFSTDENFANNFLKGSHKEQSFEIILNSDQRFRRRRFCKNFFMFVWCKVLPFTRAMFIHGSNFHEQFLKRVTQETYLCNYFKIGPGVSEKKIFFCEIPVKLFQN